MGATILVIVLGYLSGSVPYGLLLSHAAGLGDIRTIGSGNIGATNVLRTGNKSIAALTLFCDLLKGLAPVLFGAWFGGESGAIWAGFGAIAGHVFPIWLGFKGGKGVATAAGVLFGWAWPVALATLATWVAVFALRRISSLSALCAAFVASLSSLIFAPQTFWPIAALAVIIFTTHRANIVRLLKGEEPQSSLSKVK